MVGIDGDPREANDAFMAVYSAALAASGSLGSIQPGIDFFAQLKKKGNFTAARANIANISKGEVAIAIIWGLPWTWFPRSVGEQTKSQDSYSL